MARGKRNPRLKRPSDETLSDRRSSLQVNLSFVSSLSDSGRGSLKIGGLANNEVPERICQVRRNAMPDIQEDANSVMRTEEGALSVISSKEQALNQSCQLLKGAILQKTREIFDRRAELTIKTTSVLSGQRQALKEMNKDSRSVILPKRSVSLKKDSIQTSPSSKSTLATKNRKSETKSILESVARISRGDASIILSGSSKLHRKTLSKVNDKVLRVRLTRLADPRLEVSSGSSQLSQSSVFEDIGAPVTCSSFISGYGNPGSRASQRAESEGRDSSENSDVERAAGPSAQILTPMEITAVQVPVPSNKKSFTRLTRVSSNVPTRLEITTERSPLRDVSMELTPIQSHIPSRFSASSNKSARTSLDANTSANESSGRRQKKIAEEALSARGNSATRLSLRVNTSLGTQERSTAQETVNSDDGKTGTSLIKNIDKGVEDSSGNNTDPIDNMPLIARLRDISGNKTTEAVDNTKSNGTNRSSLGEGPSFVEGTPYPPSRSILWRTQIRSATLKAIREKTAKKTAGPVESSKKSSKSSDSDSSMCREYLMPPNTTVVLGDSPCRFTANSGDTHIIPDSSDEDVPVDVATTSVKSLDELPKEFLKEPRKDFSKEFPKSPPTEISKELPKDLPKENTTANTRRSGKKKLLPLYENLELVSFSPISPALPSPKKAIIMRTKKKLQKRKAARAIAAKRIESMRKEDEDEREPGCSQINKIHTSKEKAKAKKPRKIISKKIVVKKIIGMDVLEELESLRHKGLDRDSTRRRNSLNDFSQKKTVPISRRNTKSQKLVIVATGFSRGDVDLVKSIVKELGGAKISTTVSIRTTHVVSTGLRTINLLRGIIRGCWLVSLEWILKSLEKHKWLNAEQYEMVHFSKAVQENRRDRQLFGKAYVPELFTTCGPIYIERGTTPPPEILKELVKTAGGRIAENVRDSKLSVGPKGLREIWVLDSITTGDLQSIEDYRRK